MDGQLVVNPRTGQEIACPEGAQWVMRYRGGPCDGLYHVSDVPMLGFMDPETFAWYQAELDDRGYVEVGDQGGSPAIDVHHVAPGSLLDHRIPWRSNERPMVPSAG